MADKKDQNSDSLEIHSIKSTQFRVVHADGIFGGVSPKGYINCNFFSERFPIPRRSNLHLTSDGTQSAPEEILESKNGVVREYEVSVMIDFNAAVSFHAWLGQKISELGKGLGVSESEIAARLGVKK